MTRTFTMQPAQRQSVPLLIGLLGPSGSGKTYSALRLATGVQRVTGGEIVFIDTEARRALHYADQFRFQHMQFDAPFGSLDYLAAIEQAAKLSKNGIVIVDSMSHEHESPGGMLDLHEQELDRLAGNDFGKRERVKMLAWQKPKQHRRRLINGLLQINANFIFCFRAKETAKPVKNPQTGRQEVINMGFMPIAGDEFVFEMTVAALLLPGSGGVPTWQSDNVGERTMMKLPQQFRELFSGAAGQPLDETTGQALAEWSKGGVAPPAQSPSQKLVAWAVEQFAKCTDTAKIFSVSSKVRAHPALAECDDAQKDLIDAEEKAAIGRVTGGGAQSAEPAMHEKENA